MNNNINKNMSILSLVMINVIAIDSLRTIPLSASYGFALLFYYTICAIGFFIPSALVTAELTSSFPQRGGIYLWVKEAFGKKVAFTVIFIIWIYNICWYPTILSLLAATLAYIIDPYLLNNVWYTICVVISVYWIITVLILRGMNISNFISTLTAILGTLLPMIIIIIFGFFWILKGKPINISIQSIIPDIKLENMVLLSSILYGLLGMEMSAVHIQNVVNPQKNYPKAIFFSTILILLSMVLSSLSVSIVSPPSGDLELITALLDAFCVFFCAFNILKIKPIIMLLIIIGIFGQVSAWILGPAKGLLIAAEDNCIPKFLKKENSKNMPIAILISQGIIFSIICLIFLIMPTINSSYWILNNLTTQLAFSAYIFIFAAAIKLRYKYPNIIRKYRIPGNNFVIWAICSLGILSSLFAIFIGYVNPNRITIENLLFYRLFLFIGFVGFYLISIFIYKKCNK